MSRAALARYLGISVIRLHGVETGIHAPLGREFYDLLHEWIGCSVKHLQELAEISQFREDAQAVKSIVGAILRGEDIPHEALAYVCAKDEEEI